MILGLTGFSGAGKSTVASIFKEHGYYHIDCDRLVHEKVYREPAVLKAISASFGAQTIHHGSLDRNALRQCTMGNPAAMQRLNQTMMPFILKSIDVLLNDHTGEPIILDAPLLLESGLDRKCDKILSVITAPANSLQRIIARDHLTETDALKRLHSQHNAAYYIEKSDYIIINNEGIPELKKKVLELIQHIHDKTL